MISVLTLTYRRHYLLEEAIQSFLEQDFDGHYLFQDNRFIKISGNVNNGNVYTKKYLSRIEIPKQSFGEDYEMTFNNNAQIYESNRPQKTMIYRWGMNTYHISGMGEITNEAVNKWTDKIVDNQKLIDDKNHVILLHPHFNIDYFQLIKE